MTRRASAAALMLGLSLVLVLLARDVWHWQRAVADADARVALGPIGEEAWDADATLPWGLGRRLLGLDDDLAFRRAAMPAIRASVFKPLTPALRKQRAVTETALARIAFRDPDPVRASLAADYLGVLRYSDPPTPTASRSAYNDPSRSGVPSGDKTPEQEAVAQFETALRIDPGNADAKRNLEALLRQSKPPSERGAPRPGGGERVGNKGAGSRAAGAGF